VVDDDSDILETLRCAFEREGHSVTVVSDGRAALMRAHQEPPDLAVLDVMLPGLNGYEISRRLKDDMRRGALQDFPIMMLTARRVAAGARQQFLASWSQADSTLWKPYDLGVLLFQARQLLSAPAGTLSTGESA